MESSATAMKAATTAVDTKAENVLILNVEPITTVCDCFVICSAPTRIQTRDIAQKVQDALEEDGIEKIRIQGRDDGSWILIDYGDIVVHVFLSQEREFYDLEGRWSDAEVIFDSNKTSV